MYGIFYLTMLISVILTGIINIVVSIIGKRPTKIWRYTTYVLMGITVVSMIGFVVTISMLIRGVS